MNEEAQVHFAPAGASRNLDDYIDAGILDGLKRDGFFAEIERKYTKR